MKKLVVVLGPTASGKTELALKLAKRFRGEVVSADSRQIYRGMNIGTAKPKKAEGEAVKHHLVDIKNPNQLYTVWQYKRDAVKKINEILTRGKTPLLVGGTGLYIKAVIDNLAIPRAKPDKKLRKLLEAKIKKSGLKSVYEELVKVDPEAAYIVDPQNPRRVIRALEVAIKTKRPFSKQRKKGRPLFDSLQIGLNLKQNELKDRIEERVDNMVEAGLLKEVKGLVKLYDKNLPAFDAIGYRETIDHLQGKSSLKRTAEEIKKNTWRFAKRQMTWFKRDKRINWVKNQKEAEKLVRSFLA
ncbi:MAG: tRNA dimethylallyltransferase [Parcubacteria group bacterium Gr01-1014_30]|nr:MAG: tRNA dimethylallyltransferase [Parcubacteria group bacterium Gr01-1014_30]